MLLLDYNLGLSMYCICVSSSQPLLSGLSTTQGPRRVSTFLRRMSSLERSSEGEGGSTNPTAPAHDTAALDLQKKTMDVRSEARARFQQSLFQKSALPASVVSDEHSRLLR
jgi:hypothetical protein